ncbi:hypothetical protein BDV97DRAFT_401277 [Delphinella strobiligena]|nr:hypothetical protein BDV97DRAFT_401277 [Delphinella strobiligena]
MHIREMHTGERPYVCEEPGCGADFSRPWCLYRHQRSKHGGESTDQVHVGHKRRKHRGVSTDQVLVAQEDVDMNENEMENDGDDNDYAPYSHSEVPDSKKNEVKSLLNVAEGINELDMNTWTRLTAIPPPSNPALYVCMDCNVNNVHLTPGDLQAHYHVAHNVPHQNNCNYHVCSAISLEQEPWLAASSGGDNSTIDPRLL